GQTMPSSRRKILEDPVGRVPALAARVHHSGHAHDLTQSAGMTVLPSSHAFTDLCEQLEVAPLAGLQRIFTEVRDDRAQDGRETSRLPLEREVTAVGPEVPAPEVLLNRQEHLAAVTVLADRHAGPDLPTDSESRTRRDRD